MTSKLGVRYLTLTDKLNINHPEHLNRPFA
jgi:hypothetical protein